MNKTIEKCILKKNVQVPPSKSIYHRALILQSLAGGKVLVTGGRDSADILATKRCLKALESCPADSAKDSVSPPVLPCQESASTLRFLIPLVLYRGIPAVFEGSRRLFERPLSVYENICKRKGFLWKRPAENRLFLCGKLSADSYEIPGNISSQFVTGLLLVLPLLEGDSEIHLTGKIESRSYIEMTLQVMHTYGVQAGWTDDYTLKISGNQRYVPCDFIVEGDYSAAANLDALNLLGHQIEIMGLNPDSVQGDKIYRQLFRKLTGEKGPAKRALADFTSGSIADETVFADTSGGLTFADTSDETVFADTLPETDLADCPDLAPVLMALAAYFHGGSFKNTGRLCLKESDRGAAMAEELRKFGAKIKISANEILVEAAQLHAPEESLNGHRDHRIVMALAVLLTKFGGRIEGAEAVEKSFPDFFDLLGI